MLERVGQQLGGYRLQRLLGEGSFASVYLGEQPGSAVQVAIKVFHKQLSAEEGNLFRQDEALLTRLNHPHLVRVFACGMQDSTAFEVMAYVSGGTLRERHPAGSCLELAIIGSYVQQLASALQYLHDVQLVHGNLKPENILVEQENQVLLSDFTTPLIAQRLRTQGSPEGRRTSTYLAPEAIQGRTHPGSDQYALAILVYEWLSGQPPFVGSAEELSTQHLFSIPASLREHLPSVPAAVEQVVLTALAKDPRHRFASVQDFAVAFLGAAQLPLDESLLTVMPSLRTPPRAAIPEAPAAAPSPSRQPEQPPAQKEPGEARHPPFNNLPAQLTALVGREQEIQAVCALVRQPEVRLLTLIGPGGVGKTRLGLQIATELFEDFIDGVCFVSLAPLSDPALVIPTIAKTLSLPEVADQSALEQLKASLREKHLLLLLDNFEQVLSAGPELTALLLACPQLKILVTSRAVLHLQGEYEFVVPPLAVPDLSHFPPSEELAQYAAVALFVQRAKATKPDFQLTAANARTIADICRHLDGLPLAIELAAARLKLLPPPLLLARLSQRLQVLTGGARDLPARQQTLQKTIAWSYDLLTPEEQRLFRRLAVFVGGCTLEAVEAVGNAAGDLALDVLEVVGSLLDKSLVQQTEREGEEPRLVMLGTLREYGLEALTTSGELLAARQAHAAYYLRLAEQAETEFAGPQQSAWFERLEEEHDNLRAAMQYWLEQGEAGRNTGGGMEMALRLGGALWQFWRVHGHYREGRNFLERALASIEKVAASVRGKALIGAASLALFQNDFDRAEPLCEESLALYQQMGDKRGIARSRYVLGVVYWKRGNFATARALLEEAAALFQEVGDKERIAYALYYWARVLTIQGEYASARTLLEKSLALHKELTNQRGISLALFQLARVLFLSQGDPAIVHSLLLQAQALSRELGLKGGIADCLSLSGQLALVQGNAALARSLLEESVVLSREMEDRQGTAWSLSLLGSVLAMQGDYLAARGFCEESLKIATQVRDKEFLPFYLERLASVVAAQGEPVWAAHLWGTAEVLREGMPSPLPPVDRPAYEQAVATARTQLGEQAFAAAWQEGRTMKLEQVIDDVLKRGDEAGRDVSG